MVERLRSLIVEYLKVLWSSASGPLPMVEPAYPYQSSPLSGPWFISTSDSSHSLYT
jgi:hypothetical protein